MKTRYTWPLLLAACSFAACAQAPDGGRAAQMRAELNKRFAAADINVDGRLTRAPVR